MTLLYFLGSFCDGFRDMRSLMMQEEKSKSAGLSISISLAAYLYYIIFALAHRPGRQYLFQARKSPCIPATGLTSWHAMEGTCHEGG